MRWEHFVIQQEQLTGAPNSSSSGPGHMLLDNGPNKKLVMVVLPDQQLVHKLHSCRRLVAAGDVGHGSNLLSPPLVLSMLRTLYCHGGLSRGASLRNLYKQHWN